MDYQNLSIFDNEQNDISNTSHLDVVKMNFIQAESMTWQELFDGFDTLHAITYSSGIDFIYQLLKKFEQSEIIFGCDEVMSFSVQEIMAYQCKLIEKLRNTAGKAQLNLASRIDDGSLKLYVARSVLSHEKIYLLSAADGRRRVIMGSANMSHTAFVGKQRENICYMDDSKAYDWYLDCYNILKEESTDQIFQEAYLLADNEENIDKLPIAQTVRVKKAMVIQPIGNLDDVQFILDVKNLAKNLAPSMPKVDKKNGKIALTPEKVIGIRKQVVSNSTLEKEHRSEYPQLTIHAYDRIVELNGKKLDLAPSRTEIQNDVDLYLKYMAGYEKFHGDTDGLQRRYFEFANWFFCSPFMACMRDMAVRYNQNLLPYPVFGLVYGQSKAGKTSFLETLLKMMIGQKTKVSAPDFTRSSIEGLKHTVLGAPIIVDDLTNTRFSQHAIETIKNDDFGITEHMLHYPAVVISANEDVKAVAQEIIRRTVICRVQAGLTNTEVMKSNVVRTVQREIGTAFYREYLRRMLDIVPELLDAIKSDEAESTPDILAYSSQIITDIIKEYAGELPPYARTLTLEDYFSERVTGSYAIKTIQNAWRTSQTSFIISSRSNELRYSAGAPYEADRILKELPETLEAHKSREWVVMNLDAAIEFFGLTFKKSFFSRLKKH